MRKDWNNDDIDYLKEHIGVHKIPVIARSMERSYESVRVKMTRLGLSKTKSQTGFLTMGELARHLKIERKTVQGWVDRHGLPCMKKVTRKCKRFYLISPSDFWDWANINKEKVQFSDIEPQTLLPEPEWVAEERQKDKEVVKKKPYKYWTTKEDQRLLELRNNGFTYSVIGEKMNRSSISVERRYKRIIS